MFFNLKFDFELNLKRIPNFENCFGIFLERYAIEHSNVQGMRNESGMSMDISQCQSGYLILGLVLGTVFEGCFWI